MEVNLTGRGKLIYGSVLLGVSIYLLSVGSITLRHTTFDGFEIYMISAAFFVASMNMFLSLAFGYNYEDKEHPFRFYSLTLAAIAITLFVLAIVFQAIETEFFGLQGL